MANFTKAIFEKFISESAKDFKLTKATYLESVANKSYVVMVKNRPVVYDNSESEEYPTGRIMVLSSREEAEYEAKAFENAKVMTEYEMYCVKGVFNSAIAA